MSLSLNTTSYHATIVSHCKDITTAW